MEAKGRNTINKVESLSVDQEVDGYDFFFLLVDYKEHNTIFNGVYYAVFLHKFRRNILEK